MDLPFAAPEPWMDFEEANEGKLKSPFVEAPATTASRVVALRAAPRDECDSAEDTEHRSALSHSGRLTAACDHDVFLDIGCGDGAVCRDVAAMFAAEWQSRASHATSGARDCASDGRSPMGATCVVPEEGRRGSSSAVWGIDINPHLIAAARAANAVHDVSGGGAFVPCYEVKDFSDDSTWEFINDVIRPTIVYVYILPRYVRALIPRLQQVLRRARQERRRDAVVVSLRFPIGADPEEEAGQDGHETWDANEFTVSVHHQEGCFRMVRYALR